MIFKCNICGKELKSNRTLKQHKTKMHFSERIQCDICEKYVNEPMLNSHKTMHSLEVRKKLSDSAILRFKDENERKRTSDLTKKAMHRPEVRAKFIASVRTEHYREVQKARSKRFWSNNEWVDKQKKILRAAHNTQEAIRNHSSAMKERWGNEESRKVLLNANNAFGLKSKEETIKGGTIFCHSSWEALMSHLLDNDDTVASFKKDALAIKYCINGKVRMYIPDFIIKMKDGRTFMIEIKGDIYVDDVVRCKAKYASAWCIMHNMHYAIFKSKELHQYMNCTNLVHLFRKNGFTIEYS